MARIRTVKPEHWTDKELSKISLQAHLLWIGTWNFSDDKGVFEADPIFIKSQVFPRRTDVRVEQVSQWLDQLVKARFIVPFNYENEGYFINRTFRAHQKIDRPQPSKIDDEVIRKVLDEHSSNDRRTFVPVEYSRVKESTGKGEEGNCADAPDPSGVFEVETNKEKKKKAPGAEISHPFGSEFIASWASWIKYKADQFRFKYKSSESEQAAVNELVGLSDNNEDVAIAIIKKSMAKTWKGLFKLKEEDYGTCGINRTINQSDISCASVKKGGTSTDRISALKNW